MVKRNSRLSCYLEIKVRFKKRLNNKSYLHFLEVQESDRYSETFIWRLIALDFLL